MKTMSASELKAKLLAILDEVAATGERVIVTKRGSVVAALVPAASAATGYPQDAIRGTGSIEGDIVSPVMDEDDWEALRS